MGFSAASLALPVQAAPTQRVVSRALCALMLCNLRGERCAPTYSGEVQRQSSPDPPNGRPLTSSSPGFLWGYSALHWLGVHTFPQSPDRGLDASPSRPVHRVQLPGPRGIITTPCPILAERETLSLQSSDIAHPHCAETLFGAIVRWKPSLAKTGDCLATPVTWRGSAGSFSARKVVATTAGITGVDEPPDVVQTIQLHSFCLMRFLLSRLMRRHRKDSEQGSINGICSGASSTRTNTMDSKQEQPQHTVGQPTKQDVKQNITARYLKKTSLQALLEKLFEGQTEFNIRVGLARPLVDQKPYPAF